MDMILDGRQDQPSLSRPVALHSQQWCIVILSPKDKRPHQLVLGLVTFMSYRKNGGRGAGQYCSTSAHDDLDCLTHIGVQVFGDASKMRYRSASLTGGLFHAFQSIGPQHIVKVLDKKRSNSWSLHKESDGTLSAVSIDQETHDELVRLKAEYQDRIYSHSVNYRQFMSVNIDMQGDEQVMESNE